MVMMVVVIMAVAVVAAVAMPAVAIPAVVMPTVAAMVNATVTMVVVNATVTMVAEMAIATAAMVNATAMVVAIEIVGLGPRHCQCRAKPGPGIRLIRRVVIDIHAQADREGECGCGVSQSK
jgi:hypothetical protein